MTSILFKELRENAKWALLILLGLSLLMIYYISFATEPPLVNGPVQAITLMGFPAAAFALGLLQVLQDRLRGRWAFLIHRPIGRTRVFVAKAIAGLLLYFGATALPLVVAIAWVATPGHVAAPFDWHMILPRVADLAGGVTWYFAGLLTAARNARWIGSRLFPAGLALFASFLACIDAMTLTQALLIHLLAIIILVPAAWGAFIATGGFETLSAPIRFTQGITIAAGAILAYFIAVGTTFDMLENLASRNVYYGQQYQIQKDGRIIRTVSGRYGISEISDLQGHPIPGLTLDAAQRDRLPSTYLSLQGYDPANMRWEQRVSDFGLYGTAAYTRVFNNYSGRIRWYYVVARRTLEGYDGLTRLYAGCIGPNGFVPPSRPPEPFPEPFNNQWQYNVYDTLGVGPTSAYELDLPQRTAKLLFQTTAGDPILSASEYDLRDDSTAISARYDFVATASNVYAFQNGTQEFKLPLEHSYPQYWNLEIGRLASGKFILNYAALSRNPQLADQVLQVDARGQVVDRTELPPLEFKTPEDPKWERILATSIIPPAMTAFAIYEEPNDPDFRFPQDIIELITAGSICAAAALLLLRRYDSKPSAAPIWMAICFVMAIPGLLLLIAARQSVAKESCPACRRPRLVTRDHCEHCGKPFDAPANEGIEIFAIT
jgi:hypothetical protein